MHPADVMAALRRDAGWTLRGLSLASGYNETAVGRALTRPWPAVERIIADQLGLEPWEIWPSRYTADGRPKRERPTYPTTRRAARNPQRRQGAQDDPETRP